MERAARAVAAHWYGPDPADYDRMPDNMRNAILLAVRAVLEAIREPDGGMVSAGNNLPNSAVGVPDDPADVWQAMLDAILKD
jgi:hypothetical protein